MSNDQAKLEPGKKYDGGKSPMSLLPFDALYAVGQVLGYGAGKYDSHNWLKGMSWSRLESAMLRHYTAHTLGEDTDEESGLPHLAHMACCALMLLTFRIRGLGTDDRWKQE